MSFRFQRRIKILPGVTLNLSKSGVSTSIGPRGARMTFGPKNTRTTVGLPGTGLSYTQIEPAPQNHQRSAVPVLLLIVVLLLLGWLFS